MPDKLDLSKTLAMDSDAPFFLSARDLQELSTLADRTIASIKGLSPETGIRQIVIETWLLVEYGIRLALSSVLDLSRFDTEKFNSKYELLPQSFRQCLKLLEKMLREQRKLPDNPNDSGIGLPIDYLSFLKNNYPLDFKRMAELERLYRRKKSPHPEKDKSDGRISARKVPLIDDRNRKFYCVNRSWINAMSQIDDNWVKNAYRLNDVRNVAAHSTNTESIAGAFGHSGKRGAEKAKDECLAIIYVLLTFRENTK